jgi:hypothetical protein
MSRQSRSQYGLTEIEHMHSHSQNEIEEDDKDFTKCHWDDL